MDRSERVRAFTAWYTEQYPLVLGFVRRRVADQETARDVTAEVFRVAWTRFEERPSRGWLFRVARNVIGDEYRRRDRQRAGLSDVAASARTTEALGRDDGVSGRVLEVLEGLPSRHREVLVLTYWDGLSAIECGQVLGITAAAVWVRVHRARAAFAAAWSTEPAGAIPKEQVP